MLIIVFLLRCILIILLLRTLSRGRCSWEGRLIVVVMRLMDRQFTRLQLMILMHHKRYKVDLWHRRLCHLSSDVMNKLAASETTCSTRHTSCHLFLVMNIAEMLLICCIWICGILHYFLIQVQGIFSLW